MSHQACAPPTLPCLPPGWWVSGGDNRPIPCLSKPFDSSHRLHKIQLSPTPPQSHPTFDMWWSFAPVLGLFAVPVPAFAAHPQCQLVLSTPPAPPTPIVHPQSSHGPSSASGSVETSATSTPTPTPFVPFAYGSKPIRGVNLYVLFLMPGSAPRA